MTRKGFVDGRSVRLPTIWPRGSEDGAYEAATASFSAIPGRHGPTLSMMSREQAAAALVHTAELATWTPLNAPVHCGVGMGPFTAVNLPGVTTTALTLISAQAMKATGEYVESASEEEDEDDPRFERVDPDRAKAMGFAKCKLGELLAEPVSE